MDPGTSWAAVTAMEWDLIWSITLFMFFSLMWMPIYLVVDRWNDRRQEREYDRKYGKGRFGGRTVC